MTTASNRASAGSRARTPQTVPSPSIVDALDDGRMDAIAECADYAASYWSSIALAARRGDKLTVNVHLRQVGAINREVKSLVQALGEEGVQ
jgi:hypothetical protein